MEGSIEYAVASLIYWVGTLDFNFLGNQEFSVEPTNK